MDEQLFLLDILNLTKGILQSDTAKVSSVATELNANTLTTMQNEQVRKTIVSFMGTDSNVSTDFLKTVINSINAVNKNYLNSLLDLRRVNFNDKDSVKQVITSKLQDTTITFDNDIEKYNYYYLIVNYTIELKDNSLIQSAIDAIQRE